MFEDAVDEQFAKLQRCNFCEYLRCNEVQFSQSTFTCNEVVLVNYFLLFTSLHLIYFSYLFRYMKSENRPDSLIATQSSPHTSVVDYKTNFWSNTPEDASNT